MTTNRKDTTMTTRRTPTQMAQDALDTAQRKVERAEARAARATKERIGAFAALGMAMEERDYAAAHPLLKPEPEPVEVEDVTA
jgi:hypothetical protein